MAIKLRVYAATAQSRSPGESLPEKQVPVSSTAVQLCPRRYIYDSPLIEVLYRPVPFYSYFARVAQTGFLSCVASRANVSNIIGEGFPRAPKALLSALGFKPVTLQAALKLGPSASSLLPFLCQGLCSAGYAGRGAGRVPRLVCVLCPIVSSFLPSVWQAIIEI